MSTSVFTAHPGRTTLADGKMSFPSLAHLSGEPRENIFNAYGISGEDYELFVETSNIAVSCAFMSNEKDVVKDNATYHISNGETGMLVMPDEPFSEICSGIDEAITAGADIIAFPCLLGAWSKLQRYVRGIELDNVRLRYPMFVLSRVPLSRLSDEGGLPESNKHSDRVTEKMVSWFFASQRGAAAYEEWANLYRRGELVSKA